MSLNEHLISIYWPIDTLTHISKTRIPSYFECLEHTSTINHNIKMVSGIETNCSMIRSCQCLLKYASLPYAKFICMLPSINSSSQVLNVIYEITEDKFHCKFIVGNFYTKWGNPGKGHCKKLLNICSKFCGVTNLLLKLMKINM